MSSVIGYANSKGHRHGHPIHARKGQVERDGREPSAGMIHEGELTKHGYHIEEGDKKRQEALRKAVSEDGYLKTEERVNALAVVNKGHPSTHARLERDLKYLKDEYR